MGRLISIISVFILLFTGMAAADTGKDRKESPAQEKQVKAIKASYAKLPLSFVKNEGQKDKTVLFYEQGSGHATAFTKEGVSLSLAKTEVLTLTPLNPSSFTIEPLEKREGKVNYFIGKDPSKWKTDIATYGAILYKGIYPGIDMKFYGTNSQIEYDIIVAPGADPKSVRLSYKGAEKLTVTPEGELKITLTKGSIFQKKPFVYQKVGEVKKEIPGKFVLLGKSTYGFEVGDYDRSVPLVIDPTLVYSTYLGGSGHDRAYAIAVDSSGNAYVAGYTTSTNFPALNPYQGTHGQGYYDVFITKLGPEGNVLLYSTYLGGSGSDVAYAIAVDSSGNAYVAGYTASTNFPTLNPYQGTLAGGIDAFITKLNPSGNALLYSTYLGGSGYDLAGVIAVDSSGNAYVAGYTASTDFPALNSYQGSYAGNNDAFVTKLGPLGNTLVYSTYLGGSGADYATAIAVDSSGNAYVAGCTTSTNFPTLNPYQETNAGNNDAFITKLNPSGNALLYSTYLGGSDADQATAIAVDSSGNSYVAGDTRSTNFPTLNQGFNAWGSDAFIAKLNPSATTLLYSTYLGGTGDDYANAMAIDFSRSAYVAGYTYSTNFPTLNPYQGFNAGTTDTFIAKLSLSDSALYSYFTGDGLYKYESSFTRITTSQPQTMVPAGSTMYIYFSGDGLYKYDGSWTRITGTQPQSMTAVGSTMYLYFSGDGLYKYDGSWTRITTAQPQTMVSGGSSIYLYFSGDGLYKYDGSSWTFLTGTQPQSIVGSADGFYAYFTSDGLYRYNGTWTRITTGQPASMIVSGTALYPFFTGDGLYKYDGSWTLLTRTQPASIIASGDGFYATFSSDGLYKYNGAWAKITTGQPSSMVVSGTALYPYFSGDGLYKYDGSWTLLTRTQPQGMVGMGAN